MLYASLVLLGASGASAKAAAALAGTYHGSKSILGEGIDATIKINSGSAMDLVITGAASVNCPGEGYAISGSDISLPGMSTSGDCVHDALAKEKEISIKSIEYDSSVDSIKVTAKYSFISLSVVLTKQSAVMAQISAVLPSFTKGTQQTETVEDHDRWFDEFVAFHGRTYAGAERAARRAIFEETLRLVKDRNLDGALGHHWPNKFSDVSEEEFRATHLGYLPKPNSTAGPVEMELPLTASAAAKSIDWRTHNPKILTPVKDQGQCGSCWAFSATEQIETDVAMAEGKLYTLAPQQIVSCDKSDLGCNGGNTETAYEYVASKGIEAESSYPYRSGDSGRSGSCEYSKSKTVVHIDSYKSVSKSARSEKKMLTQIAKSPISVCVDAGKWQTYKRGVLGRSCGTSLDHCVQAVGYNAEQGYWIVRNSWNTDWGVDGYIYVEEGIDACGIAKDATIVTGASVQVVAPSVEAA